MEDVRVALMGFGQEAAERIAAQADVEVALIDPLHDARGIERPDLVLVGPEVEQPLLVSQNVGRRHSGVEFLFAVLPDHHARLVEALRVTPFVGIGSRCVDASDPVELERELEDSLRRARQRLRASAQLSAASVQLQRSTGEQHARGELMRREAYLAAIVDSSQDAILSMTFDDTVTTWNAAAERMYGWAAAEMVGNDVRRIVPEDRHEELERILASLRAGEGIESFETVGLTKDGRRIDVALTVSPVLDPEGEPIGGAAIARDETERKFSASQLAERTSELERSNRDLQQFAVTASHDLQEPLRMVASFCDLLRAKYGDALGEEGREWIHFAHDGAHRMQRLVADLLRYSRVGSRGGELVPFDGEEALDEALANLAGAVSGSGAEVTREPLPMLLGDRMQVAQVFQNLIGNAIKYAGEGAPRVHVSAEREGSHWTVSVRDEGEGIDAEHHESVFGIFKRLGGRDDSSGTGIGLAICQRVVERHGGRIWVESALGAGSTFRFTLPDGHSSPT